MIEEVFNSGDLSGIMCEFKFDDDEIFVCGLVYINVKPDHPLFKEIQKYKKKRIRRLSRNFPFS